MAVPGEDNSGRDGRPGGNATERRGRGAGETPTAMVRGPVDFLTLTYGTGGISSLRLVGSADAADYPEELLSFGDGRRVTGMNRSLGA
jgi:hypothetical protein